MPNIGRKSVVTKICGVVLVLGIMTGCSAVSDGYADNSAERATAATMCESMREFVRAPLDTPGLRRAWFLPFGSYEDGSLDFYAPMAAEPSDEASTKFYDNKVGQLTHYLTAPKFAAALADCLSRREGYARACQSQTKNTYRASYRDVRNERSIELLAAEKSTTLLVAEKGWAGDIEESLMYRPNEEVLVKSIQLTCEDARG